MHFAWGQAHEKCKNGHAGRNLDSWLLGKTGCCDAVPNVLVSFGAALDPMTTSVLARISSPSKQGYKLEH